MSNLNLLFEGDSISANGYGASAAWPARLVTLLTAAGYTVTSHTTAVAGSTMNGVNGTPSVNSRAATDDTYYVGGGTDYAFILDGFNDVVAQGGTDAQLWTDVSAWAAARVAVGWKPVVLTQLGYQTHDFSTFNGLVTANAARYIDLAANPPVGTQAGYKYPWTYDNTHLNDNGIAAVAKLAYIGFRSLLSLSTATVVADFSPIRGLSGTSVDIYGSGFTGATAVTFNAVNASSYTVVSDTHITATVPVTTDGPVVVTSPSGTDSSSGWLTFLYSNPPAPTVTSFTPTTGHRSTTVAITGTNLTNAATVTFPGPAGTSTNVTAQSVTATTCQCSVPAGTTAGPLSVNCGTDGIAISSTNFTPYQGTTDTILQRADLRGYWRSDQGVLNTSAAAPSDGDVVQTWYDLSGCCVDGSQTVSGYRPLYKTGQLNGYPSLLFSNAVNQQAINLTLPTAYDLMTATIYLVHDTVSPSNYGGPFSWRPGTGKGFNLVSSNGGSGYQPQMVPLFSSVEQVSKRGPTNYGSVAAKLWVWDTGIDFYVNNAAQSLSTGDNGYNSNQGGFLGQGYNTLNCNLYLVAVFAGVHDAAARLQVSNFVAGLYGLYALPHNLTLLGCGA